MPRHAVQLAFRRPGAARALALASGLVFLAAIAPADVFHLRNGGTVNGQLVRSTDESLIVRTTVGTVTLARADVERVESAPTPFAEYEQRRVRTPDTPSAHMTLADWCEEVGLGAQRRRHLLRAIELDPDYEHARRALGYVRVGAVWMNPRRAAELNPDGARHAAGQRRIVEEIRRGYFRRIARLRDFSLEGADGNRRAAAREELLAIRDPFAIRPLTEVLTEGDVLSRQVLIECLAGFGQDESTLNLAMMALLDPDVRIRGQALDVLRDRADPRVVDQLRHALRQDSDLLVARAAVALGALQAREAVPDLIALLRAERYRLVDVPLPVFLTSWVDVFNGVSVAPFGPGWIYSWPGIWVYRGIYGWGQEVDIYREWRVVTVYRTEVLESLKRITGENFGFDADGWQQWYQTQER